MFDYRLGGCRILSIGINTGMDGTGINQELQSDTMEIIATSIPFGAVVGAGILVLWLSLKVDRRLNRTFQPEYQKDVEEEANNKQ